MRPMKTAIVVLGSPNDAQGNLLSIALERCRQALAEYGRHPAARIIPTGGRGAHFNTTELPHAHYVRRHLEAHGIPAQAFLECVESSSTIEDARLCRPVAERHGITNLIVVTSDFHVPRARFLFEREFPELTLAFSAARTDLPAEELARLHQHEERALARLQLAAT